MRLLECTNENPLGLKVLQNNVPKANFLYSMRKWKELLCTQVYRQNCGRQPYQRNNYYRWHTLKADRFLTESDFIFASNRNEVSHSHTRYGNPPPQTIKHRKQHIPIAPPSPQSCLETGQQPCWSSQHTNRCSDHR